MAVSSGTSPKGLISVWEDAGRSRERVGGPLMSGQNGEPPNDGKNQMSKSERGSVFAIERRHVVKEIFGRCAQ